MITLGRWVVDLSAMAARLSGRSAEAFAEAFPSRYRSSGSNPTPSAVHDFDATTQLARADGVGRYVGACRGCKNRAGWDSRKCLILI